MCLTRRSVCFRTFFLSLSLPDREKKLEMIFHFLQNTIVDNKYTEAWTKQSANRRRMFMHSRVENKLIKTLYCEMSATRHSGEMKKSWKRNLTSLKAWSHQCIIGQALWTHKPRKRSEKRDRAWRKAWETHADERNKASQRDEKKLETQLYQLDSVVARLHQASKTL